MSRSTGGRGSIRHGLLGILLGESKAGSVTNEVTGRISLRSYGSISYVGLMSYLYARLERQDARVQAVLQWLSENYTLEENPGAVITLNILWPQL